jgi:uracil-DNA glycosylase
MKTWNEFIQSQQTCCYFKTIKKTLDKEYTEFTVYPPRDQVFNALTMTPIENIKVVILGQDPYHGPNEAHGLSFSVPIGIKIPPSLRNIFKELHNDLDIPYPSHGNLSNWASEGVLLLNSTLTVRHNEPRSHHQLGWIKFTDKVIKLISEEKAFAVFILWGKDAQSKLPLIDKRHGIIQSSHPSPLSSYRGFMDSKPFSSANEMLEKNHIPPIDWSIG